MCKVQEQIIRNLKKNVGPCVEFELQWHQIFDESKTENQTFSMLLLQSLEVTKETRKDPFF